jgi:TrmH family RNA methyltransferase
MLSKAQIKWIRSLAHQKFREEYQCFIAEGDKIACEWLQTHVPIQMIIGVEEWMHQNEPIISLHPNAKKFVVSESILETISTLQTPNKALLVVALPKEMGELPTNEWAIALEHLQDPGNMGTIIRIADWFGIKNIVCSPHCVDVYNPKVIQAAMGSHLRIRFFITPLENYLQQVSMPVIAATLNGTDINSFQPFEKAVLLIGNESKGLSENMIEKSAHRVTIPRIGKAESLNAAVATGILCARLRSISMDDL